MGRTPRIPEQLTRRPFSLDDARRAGVSKSSLRGKSWRHLGSELYCWQRLTMDPMMVLSAWRGQLPDDAVFAGKTAAWLHGLDLEPLNPIELIVPSSSGVRSRAGLEVRRCDLPPCDVATVRGLAATTVHRTLFDLCLRLPTVEALAALDAGAQARFVDCESLRRYAEQVDGRAGARRLRSLAAFAEPAESPMETRLRWLLLQAGLPRPEVQSDLHDAKGRFIGRADLYSPSRGWSWSTTGPTTGSGSSRTTAARTTSSTRASESCVSRPRTSRISPRSSRRGSAAHWFHTADANGAESQCFTSTAGYNEAK